MPRDGSSPQRLNFSYVVDFGDSAIDLSVTSRFALAIGSASTGLILRTSSKPTQLANVTLPLPLSTLSRNGPIQIDTSNVPHVLNVSCANASGIYAPGDRLIFQIRFSKAVVVTGVPLLHLDLTIRYGAARYIFGGGSHVLNFEYTVQEGDMSADLSYVDHHSLEAGYDVSGEIGTIRQVSQVC
jgi:hypothetical protein